MIILVRLSTSLARHVGNSRLWVTLPREQITVRELRAHLRTEYPTLAPHLKLAVPIVAGIHAAPTQLITDGQEVALLIPIAGGGLVG